MTLTAQNLQDLIDERARVLNEIDDILRTARGNNHQDLSSVEQLRHDHLVERADDLTQDIGRANTDRALARVSVAPGSWDLDQAPGHPVRRDGEALVLQRNESLAQALRPGFVADPDDLSLGRMIRAMVTGDWQAAPNEAELLRSQAIAPVTGGGVFVPEELSSRVIDLARNQARVFQAGAQTVVMDSGDFAIAKVAGDPTASWHRESKKIAASSGSYEKLVFHAKTLAALVKGSVETFEDAQNIQSVIEAQLAQALGLELDRVALRGKGVDPEPRGIRNHADVTIDPLTAVPANFDFLSEAIETVQNNNGEPGAVIYSARTSGKLDRLKDTTNQPLQMPASVAELRRLVSNQVPNNIGAGTNESEAYVGDFVQLLVGMRTELQIEATRVGGSTDGGAFEQLEVWIRAYLRSDIQIAQPKHFVVATEILPT
jgi:HK97 family phage major capsid protein